MDDSDNVRGLPNCPKCHGEGYDAKDEECDCIEKLYTTALIALCEQQAGKIAALESGIANELEDIRLEAQARDSKISILEALTVKLQQALLDTQERCIELEHGRDQRLLDRKEQTENNS